MEEYNKIYLEVPKEVPKETPKDKIYPEAPKDGKTFRLQQSCRVLEKLEKEAKHYASVRKKYKRCYNFLSRISTSTGTLSFCLSGSGVGTAFSGLACLSPHHLEALVLFVELRVLSPAKPVKRFLGK